MMENKELDTRKKVESIWKAELELECARDTIVTPFTEFEYTREGLEKTMEYWEEFLKTKAYEKYWKSARSKKRPRDWEYHLDKVEELFKMFLRRKREVEAKDDGK